LYRRYATELSGAVLMGSTVTNTIRKEIAYIAEYETEPEVGLCTAVESSCDP
jgi:phosphate/sulfate permease